MTPLSGRDFSRVLERHGWRLLRVSGSHHIYGKPGSDIRLSVPIHGNKPLKLGLMWYLIKHSGIANDEFR
jgi:predicted RNA binding protein YcfA (HicA-like mRNA interferase family)